MASDHASAGGIHRLQMLRYSRFAQTWSSFDHCVNDEAARAPLKGDMHELVHPLSSNFDWNLLQGLGRILLVGDSLNAQFYDVLDHMCTAAKPRCNVSFVKKDWAMLPSRSKETAAEFETVVDRFFNGRLTPSWIDTTSDLSPPTRPIELIIANFGAWYNAPDPGDRCHDCSSAAVSHGGGPAPGHQHVHRRLRAPWSANEAIIAHHNYSLRKRHSSWAQAHAVQVYEDDVRTFASFVSRHKDKLPHVAWRPTFPQHFNTVSGAFNTSQFGQVSRCVAVADTASRRDGDWRNQVANTVLGTAVPVLNGLVAPSWDAWSSHRSSERIGHDCTHYCAPSGITEYWAVYFFNWLTAWRSGSLRDLARRVRSETSWADG